MKKILGSNKGVTLIEILIATLITGVITAAMFKVYINQHHAWMIQDRVIEMQQNARASIDELSRQIRMTGFELPTNLTPLEAYDTNPDTIVISYKSNQSCDAPIEHAMPLPSAELRCDGHDVSCFYDGQLVYIWDPFDESGEFFEISLVQASSAHIQHNYWPLSKCYPKGSVILALDRVKFYIDQSDTLHPALMIQVGTFPPQVYAEDIIDLQFEYTLKNGLTTSVPTIAKNVREVGVSLTARTPEKDNEFTDNPYRFETYTSSVYLRNLGT